MHELPWLLTPPADFNDRCVKLTTHGSPRSELRSLAGYSLSMNQANRLYRTVRKLNDKQTIEISSGFSSLKLGILSNATIELMMPLLFTSALRHGVFLDIITTDFDQVAQEAYDPNSHLNCAGVDVVLLALDYRAYPFSAGVLASTSGGLHAVDALDYINKIRTSIRSNSGANCIVQTLVSPPHTLLGNIDVQTKGILVYEIMQFNSALADTLENDADLLLDVATLASNVGICNWYDERQWYLSRVPMANCFVSLYCDRVACLLAAQRGLSKKCLVLDLDNTLWDGVIGDDGLEGISVGQGSPIGESHLALQQFSFELKQRGVVLAVCSKNDEMNARLPFREHPGMLLKEDDIAVFVANWQDKASNIRAIAETLNIGLDSLVFVDDNPAEREIVRMLLPEVSVPELPKDPALFARVISAANYFELVNLTEEDASRAEKYAQNAERQVLSQSSGSVEEFLASLEMEMFISPFDEAGRKRVVQLINKTNQFNLTTRRYTEADIIEFEHSPEIDTFQVRLRDRFGDNGMVSVVICKRLGKRWEIDSWLMSCRVIKRGLEYAVCDELVKKASLMGIKEIIGVYISSEKNALVKGHYESLGFQYSGLTNGVETWLLNVEKYGYKRPNILLSET